MKYNFEEIESCEEIGIFENEYVYDLEMVDKSHTFIANDILVHNSNFLNFGVVLESIEDLNIDPVDLILDLYTHRLKDFFKKCFDIYANKRNTQNIQDFELENISKNVIFLDKKKYISDIVWRDPGIRNESLKKLKPKGIELVRGETSIFARKKLLELIKYIFTNYKDFSIVEFNKEIIKAKEEFLLSTIDNIARTTSVGDYEKYVINDRNDIVFAPKAPKHVKGAGIYNYTLFNSKWKDKYREIKSGDKVKWYPTSDGNAFSFIPNNYPVEFALNVDYEELFETSIINPINRFVTACGWTEIKTSLESYDELF